MAANLQKVIHVLVGLPVQRDSCQLLLWKAGFGNRSVMVSEIVKVLYISTVSIELIIPESFHVLHVSACWVSQNLSAHDRH